MKKSSAGFAQIFFIIVVLLTVIGIGAWIYWTQNINKPTSTKPGSYLKQITDTENIVDGKSTDNSTQPDTLGKVCGGFAGITCSEGLICKLEGSNPDVSGKCIKE